MLDSEFMAGEPDLRDVLADPLVRAVMRRDGVTEATLKEVVRHYRQSVLRRTARLAKRDTEQRLELR
ncbi:hypothetical protein [Oceanibacterium hippocampi]|nr:hypothetical protein [Oceanibacterium hippocampi]